MSKLKLSLLLCLVTGILFVGQLFASPQLSANIVISQVYGGAGSATGTYTRDYVELFNRSNSPVSLSGLVLQYGSSSGNFGSAVTLIYPLPNVTLNPGQYFLVTSALTTGLAPLPVTGDFVTATALNVSGSQGKVALTNTSVALGCGITATPCVLPDPRIIDLVAFGGSNNAEGGASVNGGVNITATQGSVRNGMGCDETDNNNADFTVVTPPVPRNFATAQFPCNSLGITTTNVMPAGRTNFTYTTSFASTGGTAPYSYAVASGAVPTGMTLNTDGTWSGFPTAVGTYDFNVTVTDSNPIPPSVKLFGSKISLESPSVPVQTTETFQIVITAPTAADASVRGRVMTPTGRGLANAVITLTDTNNGEVRRARSTSLGYFNFRDLESGDFYVLSVQSKRYTFETRSFTLNENIDELVLIAQ